ncbi:MAG: hypothetical protein JWN24_3035 [Phycisphaerales bacterium]|nr:hypothetical protein [Phycisphaerales bacterium]
MKATSYSLAAILILSLVCWNPAHAADRRDLNGDPLPAGAVVRLGSVARMHPDSVAGVAVSPDGKLVASVCKGRGEGDRIRIWNRDAGNLLKSFGSIPGDMYAVAFSPDGTRLATSGDDKFIRLWDVSTGNPSKTLESPRVGIRCLAFSPDGKTLAAGDGFWEHEVRDAGPDGPIQIWDLDRGTIAHELPGHPMGTRCLAFSPDGKTLASGGGYCELQMRAGQKPDPAVRLWDVAKGTAISTLDSNIGGVRALTFSADGKSIYAGDQKVIHVWNVAAGTEQRRYAADTDLNVEAMALSADQKVLAAGGFNGVVYLWDAATGGAPRVVGGIPGVKAMALAADAKTLFCGGCDKSIRWIDVARGSEILTSARQTTVLSAAWSFDGRVVATGCDDNLVRLWDAQTGRLIKELRGQPHYVQGMAFSPDGKLLATAGYMGKRVIVFDVATGNEALNAQANDDRALSVSFSPDGKYLAASGGGDCIWVWDMTTKESKELKCAGPECVTFSPDGKMLAASGHDAIHLWDVVAGKEIGKVGSRDSVGRTVTFSPDGRTLATIADDRIIVWELASGKARSICSGFSGSASAVPLSDGRTVVGSVGRDHVVRVVDLPTGHELHRLPGHTGWIYALALSPDGHRIVSGSEDHTAIIWELGPRHAPTKELTQPELEGGWIRLGDADATKAYQAIIAFADSPAAGVPFLQSHIAAAAAPNAETVQKLVADLNSDSFHDRQAAMHGLQAMGEPALPLIEQAARKFAVAEVQLSVDRLRQSRGRWDGDLRLLRAIEALELTHTPVANAAMKELAEHFPEGSIRAAARASASRFETHVPN